MNKKQLQDLIKTTIKNNGATLTHNGKKTIFAYGYQVAVKQYERIVDISELDTETINAYLLIAKKQKAFVGLWIDNGKAYLDISYHLTDKKLALSFGKKEQQLSILEWATMDCIAC